MPKNKIYTLKFIPKHRSGHLQYACYEWHVEDWEGARNTIADRLFCFLPHQAGEWDWSGTRRGGEAYLLAQAAKNPLF